MKRNFQGKKTNFSIWQLHVSPLILMLIYFVIPIIHWSLSYGLYDPYGPLLMLIISGPCEWSLWSANPYPYGPWVFLSLYSWSTDPFGPKGRQLEVGAQRAPRLLVFSFLLTLGVLGVLCGRCLSIAVDVVQYVIPFLLNSFWFFFLIGSLTIFFLVFI